MKSKTKKKAKRRSIKDLKKFLAQRKREIPFLAEFKIGEKVYVDLNEAGIIKNCIITKVSFFKHRAFYDLDVLTQEGHIYETENSITPMSGTIINIQSVDELFIFKTK